MILETKSMNQLLLLTPLKVSLITRDTLARESKETNSSSERRNLKERWHGNKSMVPLFLKTGIGEISVESITSLGQLTSTFLNIAAHAGHMAPHQLLLIDLIFFSRITTLLLLA